MSGNLMTHRPSVTTRTDSKDAVCSGNAVPDTPSIRLATRAVPSASVVTFLMGAFFSSATWMSRPETEVSRLWHQQQEFRDRHVALVYGAVASGGQYIGP